MTYTHDDARRDAPTITGDNKCGEGSTMWLKADGERGFNRWRHLPRGLR
jgi:hypothetical protein